MAKILKAKAIEIIYQAVEQGILHKVARPKFMSELGINRITFDTYWKEAKARFIKRQEKTTDKIANREANKVIHELETKDGQINSLVKQIQDIEKEIESGQTVECTWDKFGNFLQDKRPLNGNEIRDRRALIKSLLSDIRQIRGLNAPKENKLTVKQEIDELVKSGDVIPIDIKEDTGKELAQING